MGRGEDRKSVAHLKRNPFKQRILSQDELEPGARSQEQAEIDLLGSPFSNKNKTWGESLKTLYDFSAGQITPEEILLAQKNGFTSRLLENGEVLHWLRGQEMLGKGEDRTTYSTPSRYEKVDLPGAPPWIRKEWYCENRLSRPLHLGPAVVPLVEENLANNTAIRHEWWYKGKLIGTYTAAEGYMASGSEKIEKNEPAPGDNTPWPGNSTLANALSHCQNRKEEKIIDYIFDMANNPFVLYPKNHVSEEELLRVSKRVAGLDKKEARQAIDDLLERQVLIKKRQGIPFASRETYLTLAREVLEKSGEITPPFEERMADQLPRGEASVLDNLKRLWSGATEENLARMISRQSPEKPKDPGKAVL